MCKKLLKIALIVCILSTPAAKAADIQLNQHKTNNQADPEIATDANGCSIAVWSSYLQDGSSGGIFARRLDKNATPLADEFQVNTETIGNQTEPDIAMNAQGYAVVTWHGPGLDEEDIFAQRLEPNGQPIATQFRVNTYTADRQLCPAVAINSTGEFIIVWESTNIPTDLEKRSICGRIYNADGSAKTSEFTVNYNTAVCRFPDVVMF